MRRGLGALALAVLIGLAGAHASRPGTAPPFRGSVSKIPYQLRARMNSWHRGCPRGLSRLRLVRTRYWGFDGTAKQGRLIVAAHWARPTLRVFRKLYAADFRIRRIRLPEAYGSDDDRLGNADVTSAFNCRFVEGTSSWSEHAYGQAIDINPRENPIVRANDVSPRAGRWFVDRSRRARGMIHSGDSVVRAFRSIGWGWGGNWRYPKDYMHFSATGR